jgi:flagellar basal-body rod modification protein FlgD
MINTMNPGAVGPKEEKSEVLKRIAEKYGRPEEKPREAVKKLGKDEFFKLMVTQMQNQDPMKPKDHEALAAQMAQFSALEQMMNVNQNLEKLEQAQRNAFTLGAAGLIGKYVTADASRLLHTEGKPSTIKFEIPEDAAKLRVSILNEKGEVVREIEEYDKQKGPVEIEWNGKNSKNIYEKSGTFLVQVFAENKQGKSLPIQMQKTEVVTGVAFEGKETVLLVGDPKNPKKMLLKSVSKIVDPKEIQKQNLTNLNPKQDVFMERSEHNGVFNPQAQGAASEENLIEDPMVQLPADYKPGQTAEITPFAVEAQKKPVQQENVNNSNPNDEINPAAKERLSGVAKEKPVELQDIPENTENEMSVNPAARKFFQSSQDESTAGKLLE